MLCAIGNRFENIETAASASPLKRGKPVICSNNANKVAIMVGDRPTQRSPYNEHCQNLKKIASNSRFKNSVQICKKIHCAENSVFSFRGFSFSHQMLTKFFIWLQIWIALKFDAHNPILMDKLFSFRCHVLCLRSNRFTERIPKISTD